MAGNYIQDPTLETNGTFPGRRPQAWSVYRSGSIIEDSVPARLFAAASSPMRPASLLRHREHRVRASTRPGARRWNSSVRRWLAGWDRTVAASAWCRTTASNRWRLARANPGTDLLDTSVYSRPVVHLRLAPLPAMSDSVEAGAENPDESACTNTTKLGNNDLSSPRFHPTSASIISNPTLQEPARRYAPPSPQGTLKARSLREHSRAVFWRIAGCAGWDARTLITAAVRMALSLCLDRAAVEELRRRDDLAGIPEAAERARLFPAVLDARTDLRDVWLGITPRLFDQDVAKCLEAGTDVSEWSPEINGFEVSVHGDLNARTRSELAYPTDPPRRSLNTANPSTRGKWLCKMFGDYGIAFISGAICFGPQCGNFTSFQGKKEETMRKTVIDYVACSRWKLEKIVSFVVCARVEGYDHAATTLCLKMDFDIQNTLFASPSKKRKIDIALPNTTELLT
ncbi:hypothetical protein C8R44DRAFT_859155 [Mycena epipterygia]|nr:hypothetical protein C8R44DRAFT_859155 [Mycena epipterygia]